MQVHFTETKGRKIVFTEAGVHLIRGLLSTGFTVSVNDLNKQSVALVVSIKGCCYMYANLLPRCFLEKR